MGSRRSPSGCAIRSRYGSSHARRRHGVHLRSCSPTSSGSFSRGARHDPTWWPETQPCRAAVLGYQGQRSASRRERPRRRMTRRSCRAMLPIPFPPRDRGGRPGRADTTVTRHLSAAGSYQVTNARTGRPMAYRWAPGRGRQVGTTTPRSLPQRVRPRRTTRGNLYCFR